MKVHASIALRVLYCLALISAVFSSSGLCSSTWVLLTTDGAWWPKTTLIFMAAAALYRIALVVQQKDTLSAVDVSGFLALLRNLGIFMMALGVIGTLAIIFIRAALPISLGIFGQPGQADVAFYVIGTFAFHVASLSLPGIIVFEASRLFGFERTFCVAP